jgi:hypothetical protein
MLLGGWIDGWVAGGMDGCESHFKDCLQQSANIFHEEGKAIFLGITWK